jgi:predicted subunit of tRNA(5-methylaminomethyl-2-thiouridylate) methyltransferase
MQTAEGGSFDRETIELLRNILEEAWGSLRPEEQAQSSRSLIAERILKMAATRERDPIRLRTRALTEEVASPL